MADSSKAQGLVHAVLKHLRAFLLKNFSEFLVIGFGAYFASRTLARLSGTALWVPPEWRDAVDTLIGALGGTVFITVRTLIAVMEARSKERKVSIHLLPMGEDSVAAVIERSPEPTAKEEKAAENRNNLVILLVSLGCILVSILCLAIFMGVRSECVVAFDARDWAARQEKRNVLEARENQKELLKAGVSTTFLSPQEVGEQQRLARAQFELPAEGAEKRASEPKVDVTYKLYKPEFVDVPSEKVYLPLIYPGELRSYLDNLTKTSDADGLTLMLAHEPDHLFDIIEKQAHWQVALTDWIFLTLDVAIIMSFAAGLAGSFDVPSVLGDLLGR